MLRLLCNVQWPERMKCPEVFLVLNNLGPREICLHLYPHSESRMCGYKFSRLLFSEHMGKAEISEHMYVCLCTYMRQKFISSITESVLEANFMGGFGHWFSLKKKGKKLLLHL